MYSIESIIAENNVSTNYGYFVAKYQNDREEYEW